MSDVAGFPKPDFSKLLKNSELLKKLAGVGKVLGTVGVSKVTVTAQGTSVNLNLALDGVTEAQVKTLVDIINSRL